VGATQIAVIAAETNPNPSTREHQRANQEEFRKRSIIMNLAIAGQFPRHAPQPGNFPMFMNVDYVRVWQRQ